MSRRATSSLKPRTLKAGGQQQKCCSLAGSYGPKGPRGEGTTWTAISSLTLSTFPPPRQQTKWENPARDQDLPSQGSPRSPPHGSMELPRPPSLLRRLQGHCQMQPGQPTPQRARTPEHQPRRQEGKQQPRLFAGPVGAMVFGSWRGLCGAGSAARPEQTGVSCVSLRGLQLFVGGGTLGFLP